MSDTKAAALPRYPCEAKSIEGLADQPYGLKWGVYELEPVGPRAWALCFDENQARAICDLLNAAQASSRPTSEAK